MGELYGKERKGEGDGDMQAAVCGRDKFFFYTPRVTGINICL